ncbi:MAG: sulfate/thiosulfate ABC transporter permease CysW, partial [Pseudomonadota bacterium]
MAGAISRLGGPGAPGAPSARVQAAQFPHDATGESRWVRYGLITVAVLFLGLFLFIPLASVFYEALRKGVDTYLAALTEPDAVSAIK